MIISFDISPLCLMIHSSVIQMLSLAQLYTCENLVAAPVFLASKALDYIYLPFLQISRCYAIHLASMSFYFLDNYAVLHIPTTYDQYSFRLLCNFFLFCFHGNARIHARKILCYKIHNIE